MLLLLSCIVCIVHLPASPPYPPPPPCILTHSDVLSFLTLCLHLPPSPSFVPKTTLPPLQNCVRAGCDAETACGLDMENGSESLDLTYEVEIKALLEAPVSSATAAAAAALTSSGAGVWDPDSEFGTAVALWLRVDPEGVVVSEGVHGIFLEGICMHSWDGDWGMARRGEVKGWGLQTCAMGGCMEGEG